jgi:LysM repeat protein
MSHRSIDATAGRIIAGWSIIALASLLSACSSSRSTNEARLGGDDPAPAASRQASQPAWQQPSRYDADGAPQPAYRGGRDPVSGRAQEWAPAAPHQPAPTQSAALPPLPPATPAHQQYAPPPYAANPPVNTPPPTREAMASGNSIEVRHGDTLYRIARAYGVTVPAIMQANNLPNETIRPGQRLTIPPR